MAAPSRFTKVKVATGYLLLLLILFVALWFVQREVGKLSGLDTEQMQRADSLQLLLKEKDDNTLEIFRLLNRMNDRLLSMDDLEEIISQHDSVFTQQRVQHKVVVKRDSVVAPVRKKTFLKRLGEAFVPSKDSTVIVNTTEELTTDTLLQEVNPTDSLHEKIRIVTEQKRKSNRAVIQQNAQRARKMNQVLTERIDSLTRSYEARLVSYVYQEAENQQNVRRRSTLIIGGIAIGAVLLAAFFLLLIWRDITRSNRYRKALEEANKRAEDLLQAREKLMLTITHDFKAPLGSIIGYVDLLSQLSVDNRQRFYLDNMKSSSSHLLKLVNNLLDFHRLDLNKIELNRVAFNPAKLFHEIHVGFQPLADAKEIEWLYDPSPTLDGRFISDPLCIRQITDNLLSNAIKFTSSGSVSLHVTYDSSRLIITVSDTGKGMLAKDKEKIFREFTRLPGAQGEEGFGLGLSIVSKLVNLLEGDIYVESKEGEGSTFTVSLPCFPVKGAKEPSPSLTEVKDQPPLPNKALRILLIDDDRIQLNLTAAMLNNAGITCVCCGQLEELTEYLRCETFDLLLTDVQMPAINGFDLLTLLRASHLEQARTIPIVAVTARSDMQEADFLKHGFAGCLSKPFSVNELLAVIGGQVPIAEKTTPSCSNVEKSELLYNFSALTAFSEGDEHASRLIIESFVTETTKNAEEMETALQMEDVDKIAAIAHKMLPLFRVIGASDIVPSLIWLESQQNNLISDKLKEEVATLVKTIYMIISEAQKSQLPD